MVELEPTHLKKQLNRQNWDSFISTPFLLGGGGDETTHPDKLQAPRPWTAAALCRIELLRLREILLCQDRCQKHHVKRGDENPGRNTLADGGKSKILVGEELRNHLKNGTTSREIYAAKMEKNLRKVCFPKVRWNQG